jgi:hypothetical protein
MESVTPLVPKVQVLHIDVGSKVKYVNYTWQVAAILDLKVKIRSNH